jgi:hypothetical protein
MNRNVDTSMSSGNCFSANGLSNRMTVGALVDPGDQPRIRAKTQLNRRFFPPELTLRARRFRYPCGLTVQNQDRLREN